MCGIRRIVGVGCAGSVVGMARPLFDGVGVALLSLFAEDGALELTATAEHAARLVELGMNAVGVVGSTGAAAALEPEERRALLVAVRDTLPRRVPVIAGTGAASARQAARLTEQAIDHGADAVLALSPHGVADPRPYYSAIAGVAGDVPVIAYHFPAMASPGIPVSMLGELPIVACKDTSSDAERLLHTLSSVELPIYVGASGILSFAGPLGCAGAILALANAEPEGCIAAFAGDAKAQLRIAEAHRQALVDFPAGLKGLTAKRFGTPTTARIG